MSLLGRWMGQRPAQQAAALAAPSATLGKTVNIGAADSKQFGFANFGNTCYANSVLQALYFCAPFRELVCASSDRSVSLQNPAAPQPTPPATSSSPAKHLAPPSTSKAKQRPNSQSSNGDARTESEPVDSQLHGLPIPTSPPTLFSALRSLFVHISLHPSDRGTVSPAAFISKLKEENVLFSGSMHQDAHEFLNYLLNKIVEDLKAENKASASGELPKSIVSLASSTLDPPSTVTSSTNTTTNKHTTLVHTLFEGTLTSETRCLTCETVSARDESFLDLSIDIEQNSSVTACLRQFSASEMLCEKNKFFCDSCCGLQEAEKRMKVKKLPNVLALHLKRFKYQEDLQKYIKLSYRVAFPLELRLFNTVDDAPDPDRLYELFSIVVHIGGGPHHGHYVTVVKSRGSWLLFDDDSVDTIKEKDIPRYFGDSPSGSGYVLFYQAVDLDPASLGLRAEQPVQTSAPSQPSVPPQSSEGIHSESPAPREGASVAKGTPANAPPQAARQPLSLDIPPVLESSSSPPSVQTPVVQTPVVQQLPQSTTASSSSGLAFITRSLRHSTSIKTNRLSINGSNSSSGTLGRPGGQSPGTMSPSVPLHSRSATTLDPTKGSLSLAEPDQNGKEKDKDKKWFSTRKIKRKESPSLADLPTPISARPSLPTVKLGNGELPSNRRPSVSQKSSVENRRPSAPGALEYRHPELSLPPPLIATLPTERDASSESGSSSLVTDGPINAVGRDNITFPTPTTSLLRSPVLTPQSSPSPSSNMTPGASSSYIVSPPQSRPPSVSLSSRSSAKSAPSIPASVPPLPTTSRPLKQSIKEPTKAKKAAEVVDKRVKEKTEREREKLQKSRERAEQERYIERERERERERDWERERERERQRQRDKEQKLATSKSIKRPSRKLSISSMPIGGSIRLGGFGKAAKDKELPQQTSSTPSPPTNPPPTNPPPTNPPPTKNPKPPPLAFLQIPHL